MRWPNLLPNIGSLKPSDSFCVDRSVLVHKVVHSLRQVFWKGLARGQSLQVKQYAAYADRSVWLDWEMFPGVATEQRLSHLCHWALAFDAEGDEYGLRLPGVNIPPDCGERHREQVLRALALYGLEDLA